ncbi:MAG: hypothetical protein PXY39_09625 [archaeon]|nr:hypothetical protein [archaeon]
MKVECPQCHRPFRVMLEDKEVVDDERAEDFKEDLKEKVEDALDALEPIHVRPWVPGSHGRDVEVDEKTYEYTFKCKHCGNEWTEFKTKEKQVKE